MRGFSDVQSGGELARQVVPFLLTPVDSAVDPKRDIPCSISAGLPNTIESREEGLAVSVQLLLIQVGVHTGEATCQDRGGLLEILALRIFSAWLGGSTTRVLSPVLMR